MEAPGLQNARRKQLRELCEEYGLSVQPPPPLQPKPERPPSYRTENDISIAEELLKRRRIAASQQQQSKGTLSRAFTPKKIAWEYKEVYDALQAHVTDQGSPGVAEVLITKLNLLGGNLNVVQKSRTSLLSRRRSLDLSERSKILQIAVKNEQLEMVEILLPFADVQSLDTSLPVAMRNGNGTITKLLVRYGASASQTAEGQDAFRQACATGGQAHLIAAVLASEGRPPASWVSQSMVEATRASCLDTVKHLSQSVADGNHDGAAALKAAIQLGRRDMVLALMLGNKPPQQPGINEAFEQLMRQQNINPNEKLALAEILLCAGAEGVPVAQALVHASATYFLEMVRLLVSYGASIEYQDAVALRKAISKGKTDLVRIMLNGTARVTAKAASHCVELLPKDIGFEDRQFLLKEFLNKGAVGTSLNEALIDSAEAGDSEAVKLLIEPSSPNMSLERYETASTDYKGALALQIAVKKGNVAIADAILTHKPPSQVALAQVYPSTQNLPWPERYQLSELFLRAGLSGPCINSALINIINEHSSSRDERLISLLLRYKADVNFDEGRGIITAVVQNDVKLLEALLKGKPTAHTMAKAIAPALKIGDSSRRLQIITMLLDSGAARDNIEVSTALDTAIGIKPTDKRLIKALLQHGNADVNANGGNAVEHAAKHPDPEVLEIILGLGKPSNESIDRALTSLAKLSPSGVKTHKLETLLGRTKSKNAVSRLLIEEVQALSKTPPSERNLTCLRLILSYGADVNASKGEALSCAVASSSMQIVDLLLTASPLPMTLAWAMPYALRIIDPMDRLTYAQKILDGGMPPSEVNRALVFSVRTYPNDIPLINALVSRADTLDGLALAEAIKNEKQDIVELILGKKTFTADVLNTSFTEAIKVKNKETRTTLCRSLLGAGASGDVVSNALLAAASDGDLEFGAVLVRNGGSIKHKDGQAIVEACKSGAVGVLEMLLAGNTEVPQSTLQRAFQGATQVSNLKKRADIFRLLLELGVSGEVIDVQLVSAVRYGDEGKDLVKLLLAHGASPDFSNGEAVEKAVRSAFLESLELLLGIAPAGKQIEGQQKPSSDTLGRGLDACWDLSRDTRFTVIDWLFRAGKIVPSMVDSALHRAVNEPEPEERLIRLLIKHQASPVANNCQTLIDATSTLSAALFDELLKFRVTSEDASLVIDTAFRFKDPSLWVSERGLKIATSLLENGAEGDGVGFALAAVVKQHTASHRSVTSAFIDLLLEYGADVNYNQGEALQLAAAQGNVELLIKFLSKKPNSDTLNSALSRIFDTPFPEERVHDLITLLAENRDGDSEFDTVSHQPGSDPVVIRALSQYPRSIKIIEALLNLGFYHDQTINCRVIDGFEESESVTLLMWALLQPQKRISTGIINLLIERGAKVNFETATSHVTPLMVAIRTRRQDVSKSLLLAGAEVDVTDALGNSPLSMASAIGGELSVAMMSNLLAAGAGASKNDGSLHNAARELNIQAMQVLVEYRHDPDFPSPLHGGRSALAELCLHATDSIQMTIKQEKAMERAIEFLLKSGTDITIQSEGKSTLLLAFESNDPLTTTKVLLRAALWKDINSTFNQYNDGKYTFSPTMYVQHILPDSDTKADLLRLLRSNRCIDVYYANSGPQPDSAVGLPSHLLREEQERKSRLHRLRSDNEDHVLAIQRSKELAAVQADIWANQVELEEARKKRAHSTDLAALQDRARIEEDIFNATLRQQRAKQIIDLQHQEDLAKASVARARTIGDAERAVEDQRQVQLLAWEREVGSERVGNASQLSSIRLREREDIERLDKAADSRFTARLKEQKKLVDSQSMLAANLNSAAPGARRQLGFISGEIGSD
ncbi:hypothetical protein F5Y03DRAFT_384001 [Xylaria venustula]|nr:hypothetical protein F5Y03DRAFT_384001 [Xylaria venustula]